jgi:hypothetical protein
MLRMLVVYSINGIRIGERTPEKVPLALHI